MPSAESTIADAGRAAARNAPCPCGSGRRYKACCGAVRTPGDADAIVGAPAEGAHGGSMQQALLLHKAGHLAAAEARYREALADAPGLADALHMLGVICLQAGDSLAAMHLLRRAGDAFSWRLPAVRQNLGLALASVVAGRNHEAVAALWAGYDRYREELQRAARPVAPRVGVVIPSYDHAGYIDAALESVYAQTYRDIEIVVIDDGSTDGSVAVIERALARSPFPARFMARANRGAAPTINEAVAMCDAPFINVLNSDDRFAPTRVQAMVDAVAGTGSAWGFSRVEMTDAAGAVRERPEIITTESAVMP